MSGDNNFIDGLLVKAPHERAPEYVKAKLSLRREQLIKWLQAQDGEWINADVKVSQSGKWYAAVDTWKPTKGEQAKPQRQSRQDSNPFPDDEIPF